MVSIELFTECKEVFLRCNHFKNAETDRIRDFCRIIDGLGHLALQIPRCDLPTDLAEAVLYILWEKPNYPIIPVFVEVLKDSIPQGDARRIEFDELLSKIKNYINSLDTEYLEIPIDKQTLFNSIIEIDFKDQENTIVEAIHWQEKHRRKAAFLLNGYDHKYGQRIFIERLSRKLPALKNGRKIKIELDSGREISYFWNQIAPEFFGSYALTKMTQEVEGQIIAKIEECLQSQNLILIFYVPEHPLPGFLTDLILSFWQPIVDRVNHRDTYLTMFLIEQNHKELGIKSLSNYLTSDFQDGSSYPSCPLYVEQLGKFSGKHLHQWLDNGVEDKQIRQGLLAGTSPRNFAEKLWKETELGIPELVYRKICRYFNVSWEEIDQCQIQ